MSSKHIFALGPWPPLISHLTALLLGCTFTYFSSASTVKTSTTRFLLPRDSVTITLGMDWMTPDTFRTPNEGTTLKSVALLTTDSTQTACKLIATPVTMMVRQPHISFTTPLENLIEISSSITSLKRGALALASPESIQPLCSKEPKITYGSLP